MAGGQLADHLADHVVQVEAALDVRQQDLVFLLHRRPVDAVHVLEVEAVAERAPGFVEDLGPLLPVVHVGDEVGEVDGLLDAGLAARDVGDADAAALGEQGLAADDAHLEGAEVGRLTAGEVDARQAAAAVPEGLAVAVDRAEEAGADRELDDALGEAVGVHLHGRGAFLLLIGAGAFLLRGRAVLRQHRGRGVGGEHRDVEGTHVAVGVVPLDRAVGRGQVALCVEDEVLAVGAEDRGAGAVPLLRDRDLLAGLEVVDVDDAEVVRSGLRVGDPLAVGGEDDAAELRLRIRHQDGLGAAGDGEADEAVLAVRVEEGLRIRGPGEAADVGVVRLCQLGGRAGGGVIEVNLRFAGAVGDVGDVLAVRAVGGAALVRAGGVGDVAGHAGGHGDAEDLAAGGHGHAVAERGDAAGGDEVRDAEVLAAGVDALRVEADVDFLAALRRRVELVQVAGVLEDDQFAVRGGELDVIFPEIGDLGSRAGLRVVDEDVHPVVAVGDEVDLVADPHRHDVLGGIVGDVGDRLAVVDPDVVGLAALVVLPGAELAHRAVVGEFLPVGGVAAEAAFRERDDRAHAAGRRDGPELAFEAGADAVAVDNGLAVGIPAHHDVVRAHPVAEVVAGVGRRVGQAHRRAAGRGNRVDFRVAVILAREGDRPAVRGEPGEHLVADVGGEAHSLAAGERRFVQIPRIGEHDVGTVRGRETQQAALVGAQESRSEARKQRTDNQ